MTTTFELQHKKIKTLCVVYASKQKQQKQNYVKIPIGTIGKILSCVIIDEYNIEYLYIKFSFKGQNHYCKVSKAMVQVL
jgi:hypothetical protein